MAMIRARHGTAGKRWQWRVTRKGFPPVYGTCATKACARECAAKAEEDLHAGRVRGLSIGELLDRFEAARLPEIPDSADLYRRHLLWWKAELGGAEAATITPQRIAAARQRLREEIVRTGERRKPASINRYLNTLSSAFRWGSRPEIALVDRNPVRDVPRDREQPRVRFLTRPVDESESELERLLAGLIASTSPTLPDLVVLLILTGCRISELLAMEDSWIRLSDRGFSVPVEIAKTDEPRFVPLEGRALEIVSRRLEAARARRDRFIFPGIERGTHATFPRDSWERLLRRSRISNLRPHDLRHTHGSYLAMMGKSLPEIMQALGHKSIQSTMRYAHLASQHKSRVAAELGAQLDSWTKPPSGAS